MEKGKEILVVLSEASSVAVISNVVRKNSALAHQTLATRVHQIMEKDYEKKESISGKGHSQK